MSQEWVSLEQAAVCLGVSVKSIRRYIASGLIDGKRFGPRLIRVRRSSVESFGTAVSKAG